jgi:hypothetical protein
MRRGAHAADDGSFNRSAAIHTGRAAVLLVVAFLIGVGLLHSADKSTVVIGTTGTTAPKKTTTTTSTAESTSTTAVPRDPRTVKVLAANGTSTNGIGDKLRRKLLTANYDALPAVTATNKVTKTTIYYTPGYESEAQALATALGVPSTSVQAMPTRSPVPQVGTANIVVVAGQDLVVSLTSTSTTASTAKPTTGTTKKSTTTTAKSNTTTTHESSSTSSSSSSTTTTTRP